MRNRLFEILAKWVTQYAVWILIGAFGLSAVSLWVFEFKDVKFETRILDLLPASDSAAIEYNNILEQYDSASQIIIGLKGEDKEEMIRFANQVENAVKGVTYTSSKDGKSYSYVKHTLMKLDIDFIEKHGLMLTKRSDLENLEVLFSSLEMADLLAAYNDFLEMEYIEDTQAMTEREKEDGAITNLKAIVHWLQGLERITKTEIHMHAKQAVDLMTTGEQYMFSQDDTMLIGMVVPTISIDRMEETIDGASNLRAAVNRIQKAYPNLEVRLTGMPVISLEELEVTESDMGIGTVASLVLILVLFVVSFRMWTAPLLAILNLMIGIIWTLFVISMLFGRFNLMTAMFAIILVGLGIDFAIHLNAAYASAAAKFNSPYDRILKMYQQSGNGVVTGALTTATAFLMLAFTGLEAFVELGVILASGIVLTLISSMLVLPSMYMVVHKVKIRWRKNATVEPSMVNLAGMEKLGDWMMNRKVAFAVCIILFGVTAFFVWKGKHATFESNMLEIEPKDMSSVILHREVLNKFEINPDFAMLSVASIDEARKISDRMKTNRLVGRVDSIAAYVPTQAQQQRRIPVIDAIVENTNKYLAPMVTGGLPLGSSVAAFPTYIVQEEVSQANRQRVLHELTRLQMNIKEIGQMAFVSMKNRLADFCESISGGKDSRFSTILQLKNKLSKDNRLGKKIANYQREYIPLLAAGLQTMASISPLTIESVPATIKSRYISAKGENLVTIYAAVNLWDGNKMELFNAATEKISKSVTGTVVLMDRLVALVGSKGTLATALALGAVFVILLIDFRSIQFALLGLLPLLTGFAWMIGLFTLFDLKFDVANVAAIPLILGIGIDDAVHVLHGIKREGIMKMPSVLKHTGRALVLTSVTTAIAFGSIAMSAHRGLAGMGILLTLGVGCCLVTSVILLPAVLRVISGKKEISNKEVSV